MYCTPLHQGWQLERQRLASTCREDCELRLMRYGCTYGIFLQWLSFISTELLIAEVSLQVDMRIKQLVAVGASIVA